MSRHLLYGTAFIALAGLAAAPVPAMAQVLADVSIEGPIQDIDPTPGSGTLGGAAINWAGTMKVMGVQVRVLTTATVHTPTNENLGLDNPALTGAVPDANKALKKLDEGNLPGRTTAGFNGGTAIITGESEGGIIYATDVFSDFAENVVVGEATGLYPDPDEPEVNRVTINKMILMKIDDPRMPGGVPINGFGFEIDPETITAGSLLAAEGYFAGTKLYYHTIEADTGSLMRTGLPEVSVLRASCRIRGRSRDELEVRGGTHDPANGTVTIQYLKPNANPQLDDSWQSVAPTAAPSVDTGVSPPQGLYRYSVSNLNLGTVCPAQVRALLNYNATTKTYLAASPHFTPDRR
jgi:hypothetical protein